MVPDVIYPILIVDDELAVEHAASAGGQAIRRIVEALRDLGNTVLEATTAADGLVMLATHPDVGCLVVDWDAVPGTLPRELAAEARFRSFERENGPLAAVRLIGEARKISATLPVMICTGKVQMADIPTEIIALTDSYIWKFEDTTDFIAGRIDAALVRYTSGLLPPFFGAMVAFAQTYEYSWHTPGHAGGTAFLKSPAGKAFHHFVGENMLRSDLSISVDQLGSLNDHTGPVKDAEDYAAKVFGADMTFFVTNGSSTSNRVILQASVTEDDPVLIDRNCHKSLEHGMILTGLKVQGIDYLWPEHNWLGILGPVAPGNLKSAKGLTGVHTVVTNSTYDGVCYNVSGVLDRVGGNAVRVHFDEAWYAYARFNPMYQGRYGMTGDVPDNAPTVVVTHSTHKLLAALSQASMIHIKNRERGKFDFERFNESFMMHSSTSPQYGIIASTDVSTAMMAGRGGERLTQDCIDEAISFRKTMLKVGCDFGQHKRNPWWFGLWQPPQIETVDTAELATDPKYWWMRPGEDWHGFADLEGDDWAMLDPIKVTVLTPGAATRANGKGVWENKGIPAPIVSSFLSTRGVVVEKTGDYSMLFLFSMGVTKGKSGTLVNSLCEFKTLYDRVAPLEDVLPDLVAAHPDRYKAMSIRDLCDSMHIWKMKNAWLETMAASFAAKPDQDRSPADAYRTLVKGEVEQLGLAAMANRTLAVGVVPYPPGIPMLLPGEKAHKDILAYLTLLERFDQTFPGFGHDIHGVSHGKAGEYLIYCCKTDPKATQV
jgi:arginine decarboxylase